MEEFSKSEDKFKGKKKNKQKKIFKILITRNFKDKPHFVF